MTDGIKRSALGNQRQDTTSKVIYDFGMNNGDDVEYYLLKAARVIGVEANPVLCAEVRKRFSSEIVEGRLTVINVALAKSNSENLIPFYVHKYNHVLSQLPKPPTDAMDQFKPIRIACRTPASIVREFGEPLYVKIDVEHFDFEVLQNLFGAGIFPPEISAESHSIDVFAALVVNGYNAFSLVDGSRVAKDYGNALICTREGAKVFRFKHHSAGPFGEDIRGAWEDANTFFHTLAIAGLGWKDIHASTVIQPTASASSAKVAIRHMRGLLRKLGVAVWSRLIARSSS